MKHTILTLVACMAALLLASCEKHEPVYGGAAADDGVVVTLDSRADEGGESGTAVALDEGRTLRMIVYNNDAIAKQGTYVVQNGELVACQVTDKGRLVVGGTPEPLRGLRTNATYDMAVVSPARAPKADEPQNFEVSVYDELYYARKNVTPTLTADGDRILVNFDKKLVDQRAGLSVEFYGAAVDGGYYDDFEITNLRLLGAGDEAEVLREEDVTPFAVKLPADDTRAGSTPADSELYTVAPSKEPGGLPTYKNIAASTGVGRAMYVTAGEGGANAKWRTAMHYLRAGSYSSPLKIKFTRRAIDTLDGTAVESDHELALGVPSFGLMKHYRFKVSVGRKSIYVTSWQVVTNLGVDIGTPGDN